MKKRIAVVGAGWAGLSCAVHLVDAGHDVQIFEAAPMLGGRARYADWQQQDGILRIDNGQHILLGAYDETLRLLKHVGVNLPQLAQRAPLTLYTPLGLQLRLPTLPAPLHLAVGLLTASGLSWADKRAAIRMMRYLKLQQWKLLKDCSMAQLLQIHRQPERLAARLWRPLCLAALNTPPEIASAQVFVNVLRDSLGGHRAASDLILPTVDLTTLFPQAAADHIAQRGGKISLHTRITHMGITKGGYLLQTMRDSWFAEAVVLAVPPNRLAELIGGLAADIPALTPLLQQAMRFKYQSITTCYLQYAHNVNLPAPMCCLHENHAQQYYGQWVFDREALCQQAGMLAVVISADGPHLELENEVLAEKLDRQLRQHFPALPALLESKVITEKRATHSCVADMQKPESATGLPGLYLAGDWLDTEYPATLEAAARSGRQACQSLLNQSVQRSPQ
jgi:squalene-associated FAD-dependent desaturase